MESNLSFIEKKSSKRVLPKNKDAKLERAKTLTHLYMHSNGITNIGDLSACEKLTVLYLHDNEIEKIENLDSAVNLRSLYLQRNKIAKIENLQKLVKLQKLYLGHNCISVIEGLETLVNLQELHVEKQGLKSADSLCFDPRSIAALSNCLQVINISHNNIASLKYLSPLKYLVQINASHNSINDLKDTCDSIKAWYYLKQATLSGNPICRFHRYRESIIANTDHLTILDGKSIADTTRSFIKRFEHEKQHGLTKQVNIADGIKGVSKNYPLPLQNAVSVSLMKYNEKSKPSFDNMEEDVTSEDVYTAWNALPQKHRRIFKHIKKNDSASNLKSFVGVQWQL